MASPQPAGTMYLVSNRTSELQFSSRLFTAELNFTNLAAARRSTVPQRPIRVFGGIEKHASQGGGSLTMGNYDKFSEKKLAALAVRLIRVYDAMAKSRT